MTRAIAVLSMTLALMVTACGGAASSPSTPPGSAETSSPPVATSSASAEPTASAGLRDAKEVALEAAGGQAIGGTVNLLGVLGGKEQDSYLSVYKPFEEATGITIEYESTRDLLAVLQTRVDGGNPPDVAATPGIGQMLAFIKAGKVIDLSQFLDMATFGQDWDQGWIDLASRDGKLYAIFNISAAKGLIWYNAKTYKGPTNPATWDELAAWAKTTSDGGTTPWCIGLESGAASGWPATDWIEDFLLRQSGPEVSDAWWRGELAWTSPEVRAAFEAFGAIATDPKVVYGGSKAVLATAFLNGGDGLFTDPPNCYLHHQADWFGGVAAGNFPGLKPVEDYNFFPFPAINSEHGRVAESAGEMLAAFNDTPQVRAFMKYTASPEAQAILATTGLWLAPNKRVPASSYPTDLTRQAAQQLVEADAVRFDPSDLMPQAMNEGFWHEVLNYVKEPASLDAVLAELDRIRLEAYK